MFIRKMLAVVVSDVEIDKQTIARNILAQDGVRNGLVCVLSCIEPCWKFEIHRNRMTKKLELKLGPGQMPVPLSLPDPSGLRLPPCSHSNLVLRSPCKSA